MIRYLTAREVAALYRRPIGTVYWLAARDQWRRAQDRRKPALYSAEDVERTFAATRAPTQLDSVTCNQAS